MSSDAALWRSNVPRQQIRIWGDDHVVYNPLTGHTHMLDGATGELLVELAEQPRSAQQLTELVAGALQVAADAQLAANIGALLDHLDEVGLASPALP